MVGRSVKLDIKILSTPKAIALKARDIVVTIALRNIDDNGVFTVAVPGGKTPKVFFELLPELNRSKQLPWDKTHIFWTDERFVPADSVRNNYKLAYDTFLSKVDIPSQNIHAIPTGITDPEISSMLYEKAIRDFFCLNVNELPVFDLVILGVGNDGHIASLFPDNLRLLTDKKCVAVTEKEGEKRITLTAQVIKAAKRIIVLVCGEGKSRILKGVLTSKPDNIVYPAQILLTVPEKVTWLIDKEAAKLL